MPLFSYSATNALGDTVSGSIDAVDIQAAQASIREMGLEPVEVLQSGQEAPQMPQDLPAEPVGQSQEVASVHFEQPVEQPLESAEAQAVYPGQEVPPPAESVDSDIQFDVPAYVPETTIDSADTEGVGFSTEPPDPPLQAPPMDWTTATEEDVHQMTESDAAPSVYEEEEHPNRVYHPLSETLRLYAGWLLAWYLLVYALGGYVTTRDLPFDIPYVQALLPPFSPLVFTFTIATFLFLFMTSINRLAGRGVIGTIFFSLLGIVLFVVYRINV